MREGLSDEDEHTIRGAMKRAGVARGRVSERAFLLRWLVESNIGVIPRSASPPHVAANLLDTLAISGTELDDVLLLVDPHTVDDDEEEEEGDHDEL